MAGQAEVELGRLLIGSDSGSREARVALLAYYVGEHPAEELFCGVLKEPELTAPLVAKYSACRPLTSVEHQLAGVVVLGTVYAHVSEALAKGEKC